MAILKSEYAPDFALQSADGSELKLTVSLWCDYCHVLGYVVLNDFMVAEPRVWKSVIIHAVSFASNKVDVLVFSEFLSIVQRDFALASKDTQTWISFKWVYHKPWPLAALFESH